MALKNPILPPIAEKSFFYSFILYSFLSILVVLAAVFLSRRLYNNLPSQKFLREIRKAMAEVQKNRLPIQVWRLLRTELVWGFQADVYTPAQLRARATRDRRLTTIAFALQSLEAWRYSGSETGWDRTQVATALTNAEALVHSQSKLRQLIRRNR
jgi:hypothetical protein